MKHSFRKTVSMLGAFAAAVALPLAGASSAQADSAYGCKYPEVCIYQHSSVDSSIIGRYKQITSGWQNLKNPETRYAVYNTRNGDVAYVKERGGHVSCIKPNGSMGSIGTIVAIRIDGRSSC